MKKYISYSLATSDDFAILENLLQEEKYHEFVACNIRFAIVLVNTSTDEGEVIPSFSCLPCRVKLIGIRDRLLKDKDVEIHIDENYWNDANDNKRSALLSASLGQLQICKDKEGIPQTHEDGIVKLKLIKPDIIYFGYSNVIEEFGEDSPDLAAWNDVKREFSFVLS